MGAAIQMPAGSPKAVVIRTMVLIRKEDESRRDGMILTENRNRASRIRADLYKAPLKMPAASKTPAILKK